MGSLALVAVVALVVAGVASSSRHRRRPATRPRAAHGPVTLLVWDQEVRGGQNAAMTQLNKNFQKKYPNIKINRVAKSFTDLQATLKLAASGPNPPDVIEVNNGYSAMGPLVKAGLLLNLNKYVGKYGWNTRYSSGILKMNKFTSDGNSFGIGNLYGLPMTGEVVGVYYNKAKLKKLGLKVPTTFPAFPAAVVEGAGRGETPIQFGNLDKWPGIHEFEEVMLQNVTRPWAPTGSSAPAAGRSTSPRAARSAPRRSSRAGPSPATSRRATRVSATTRRGPTSARARASS